jgi:hypothetical protein
MARAKKQPAVYLSHLEAERAAWEEERQRLTARIAELEAKGRATRAAIGRLDVLACTDSDAIWWEFGGVRFDRAIDAVDAVISAIETPDPLA